MVFDKQINFSDHKNTEKEKAHAMRYPLITIIISMIWLSMLVISAADPTGAPKLYYLALAATVVIFHIGFQTRT